jgi:ABC-type transport system involved in multi-copper enzyme maturation permease subunit
MTSTLFAEFRKFTTVRSTYIVSLLSLLLGGFIAFWGIGYKGGPVYAPTTLQHSALTVISIVGTFVGILAILLICHEYRYNTIGYTLTASNNRLKVLLAKFIVLGGYALIMAFITILVAMGLTMLGVRVGGHYLGPQTIDLYSLLWKSITYMVGAAWLGLVLGFLSRSLVFAIVAYFLIPSVEPILHALLKISNNYLPSAAQSQILQADPIPGTYSPLASLGVFSIYLAVGFVVSVVLFMRKDAN